MRGLVSRCCVNARVDGKQKNRIHIHMELAEIVRSTENWCKEKHINVIWAELQSSLTRVAWNKENDLDSFLEIASKNDIKNIIVTEYHFDFSLDIEDDLIKSIDDREIKEEAISKYYRLEKLKGELEKITIAWIQDGIIYEYSKRWNMYPIVQDLDNLFESYYSNNIDKDEIETHNGELFFQKKMLPDTKIEEIGKKLASHDDYFYIRFYPHKLDIVLSEIFKLEGLDKDSAFFNMHRIKDEANLFFEKNLLKEKEKELISKIKEYKEQGLPKVAISSKLGISGRMLNKYYFQIE